MKKARIILWLVIFGLLALIIFQNEEFFMAEQSFRINVLFAQYTSPMIPSALLFVLFFVCGLIISYLFGLFEKLKANKINRELRATIDSHLQMIASLKSELEGLKGEDEPPEPEEAVEPAAAEATQKL
jgi:hypothetical protein